jgi:RNA polymerase sigma factor (sigma-70 family)
VDRLVLHRSESRPDVDHWFVTEILPLEQALTRFLRRNWHNHHEVADLRQEIYVRVYEAARRERPFPVKPFLFLTGRNLMIDRLRQRNVVKIETMDDIGWQGVMDKEPGPERRVAARQELRRMQAALDELPPRCRQVIILRRVHGFSQREVAKKLGIKEETVENQVVKGMRILADATSDKRGSLIASARRFLGKKDRPDRE